MAYTPTNWTNETAPPVNSTNLNKIEQGIADAHTTADAAAAGLAGKANTTHTHTTSQVTGLDAALATKLEAADLGAYPDATGQPASKVAQTDGADGWTFIDTPTGGGGGGVTDHGALTGLADADHPISAVQGLQTALDGKAATSHTHTTAQVTGLDTALAGKASTSHAHATSDVTGLDAALADKADLAHTHPGELEGIWKYDDNPAMTSPASGRLRTNASGAQSVTQVAVHNTTLDGLDMERFFTQLSVNDVIRFQQTDESNNYGSFRITSPVTVTGVYTIANVVFVDGGGVDILNNADLYVRIVYGTQGTTPLAPVATSGLYSDLSGTPTLGTAADNDETDFATAAQGALAATSVQRDATYATAIDTITPLSQAQYDGIGTKSASTLYVIV